MFNERPRVLLFGNGLLQCYGGESWNAFLASIAVNPKYKTTENVKNLDCPAPLKAILVTNDSLKIEMENKCKELLQKPISNGLKQKIKQLIACGFDHILTTNYTYEIEQTLQDERIGISDLKKMTKHTNQVERAEQKYLLHTYNEIEQDGNKQKIWHIHGELRKPNSTILGHYYYGKLICRIQEECSANFKNYKTNPNTEIKSWVDAFLLGDVYCLGFGMDFSEFDLWWLLNRKAREKYNRGQVYFYEAESDLSQVKYDLMRIIKRVDGQPLVNIINCNCTNLAGEQYADFYDSAIHDIEQRMKC